MHCTDKRWTEAEMRAADDEREVDEVEERALRYARSNGGASEVELVAALSINRMEAHYQIRRMLSRKVLSEELVDRRHPLLGMGR